MCLGVVSHLCPASPGGQRWDSCLRTARCRSLCFVSHPDSSVFQPEHCCRASGAFPRRDSRLLGLRVLTRLSHTICLSSTLSLQLLGPRPGPRAFQLPSPLCLRLLGSPCKTLGQALSVLVPWDGMGARPAPHHTQGGALSLSSAWLSLFIFFHLFVWFVFFLFY